VYVEISLVVRDDSLCVFIFFRKQLKSQF
jgi:hypothetical protein